MPVLQTPPTVPPKGMNQCREYKSRIIVDLDRSFLYCPIPKVANTNWKVILSGIKPEEAAQVYKNPNLFQTLSCLPPGLFPVIKQRLYKFVFVRDPYTRLLSAYRNKFESLSTRPAAERDPFFEKCAPFIKASALKEGFADRSQHDLSFREFVLYVCRQPFAQMDEHWHPQALLACIDEIDYNFVGRFETMGANVDHVLRVLGIVNRFPTPEEIRFLPTNSSHMLASYYTDELKELVREKFEMDFRAFGY